MKFLLGMTLLLFSLPQSGSDISFELKGEAPGMTLKQFRLNHKHADCLKQTATITHCHVSDGVSFAGVLAGTFRGCPSEDCGYQGIFANFVNDKMVSLPYRVAPGSAKQIIAALRPKYGEPVESSEKSATWRNSVAYLKVSENSSRAFPSASYTDVTSALNDSGGGKDI